MVQLTSSDVHDIAQLTATPSTLTKDYFKSIKHSIQPSSPSTPNAPTTTQPVQPIKLVQQLTDDFEPGEFDWLIEDIFDKGRLHMICGPQGSGKTRFFLRMINDWSKGIPVLGFPTTPAPFIYVDAARDKKSIKVALRGLGIPPSDFTIIDWSALHNDKSFTDFLSMIPKEAEVIFIDNLALMLRSDTHQDPSASYTTVTRFLSKLKTWMNQHNKTVIFTHTFIKTEVGHKYASPRSKVYGAQTWLQEVETAILFDEENPSDLRDPYRLLDIIAKNFLPKNTMQRRFKMEHDGRLTPAPRMPNQQEPDAHNIPEREEHLQLLEYVPEAPDSISTYELATKSNMPLPTTYRHIKKLYNLGLVDKKQKRYSKAIKPT